ncbi:methyltransferase domain-containing protein [Candidimonas sp. SYP-B2681]|uniref:O-linked N-acetylglucosamine transferase family protein n=1 Tax=Candidimonas sp. SYP-B2681 TaxID=2497686 RepID=UPI000F8838D7|nr:methyltransferase regulatory domain-containing protein [Candidimonas sp. SYP-B2681]RTZ47576.1 methyltransferase domain-containing protein [Candidimonas sp. SYP-B2681]
MRLPNLDQDFLAPADPGQGVNGELLSPEHLRAAAYLHGVAGNPVSGARVLELGCGAGTHLIAWAQAYPRAQVVGVDLDPAVVEVGQAFVQEHGLGNIALLATDLGDLLQSDFGQFDYIVIRGVFSLLANDARQVLLDYCAKNLAPEGLLCCQYSTYPGWRAGDTLRDALLLQSGLNDGSDESRLAAARSMLTFLSIGLAQVGREAQGLQGFVAQAEQESDDLLSLKYLQGLNTPCYLIEFTGMAEQAGLTYVSDVHVQSEMPEHYGKRIAELCAAINPGQHKVLGQQYLDFLVNRSLRCSILTRAARADDVLPSPDLSRLKDFQWTARGGRQLRGNGSFDDTYRTPDGQLHQVTDPDQQAVLDALTAAWPASLRQEQLTWHCQNPEVLIDSARFASEAPWRTLRELFLKDCFGFGFRLPETMPAGATQSRGLLARPRLELACGGQQPGWSRVSNDRYETWLARDEALAVARLFDGITDFDRVFERFASVTPEQARTQLMERFCGIVDALRHGGLLLGGPSAWAEYFRFSLETHADGMKWMHAVLPWLMHGFAVPALQGGGQPYALAFGAQANRKGAQDAASRQFRESLKKTWAAHLNGPRQAALEEAQKLAQRFPRQQDAWKLLAMVHMSMGRDDLSTAPAVHAIALASNDPDIYYILVNALWKSSRNHAADLLAKWLLLRCPTSGPLWNVLGTLRREYSDAHAAELFCTHALKFLPNDSDIMNNLGNIVSDLGAMEAAVGWFEKALAQEPNNLGIRSNYLFALLHNSHISPEALFAQHRAYGQIAEENARKSGQSFFFTPGQDPERPLRIGFVSADLRNHAVSSFIERIWRDLDKARFSIYAYSNALIHDAVSERLKRSCAQWRPVAGIDDVQLARLIQEDQIDILIDLSGHTAGSRLPMFAFRPAPVQMGWIGYPCTTGLEAMDYYIADKNMAEPGELERQFTEALIYLPPSSSFELNVQPAERITQAPCLRNGYVTFASLNRPKKISEDVLKIWAAVLTQARDARMLIGNMFDEQMSVDISKRLQRYGVAPEQLTFRLHTGWAEYIALHRDIDILLDTFPYTGGTTSANAVLQGIPTVTLNGKTMVGKQGVAIMKAVGLEAFIASSSDEYVDLAVKWSHSVDELARIRAGYRPESSGRVDPSVQAAFFFEAAMREAWRRFCLGLDRASFSIESRGIVTLHGR